MKEIFELARQYNCSIEISYLVSSGLYKIQICKKKRFMSQEFCDNCGQHLDWSEWDGAKRRRMDQRSKRRI